MNHSSLHREGAAGAAVLRGQRIPLSSSKSLQDDWCTGLLLCKSGGGKERENKAVTSLGKPEIHSLISLAFFLAFVQGGKEVGFDNFIVDMQEWELRGYSQILP